MNCLVLGASGFLGINLCTKLLKNGHKVWAYSSNSTKIKKLLSILPDINVHIRDFVKEYELSTMLKDIDIVFHLISTTNPSNRDVLLEFESNVIPTIRLLNACIDKKIKIIYFSSGGTVYGIPRYIPIDEKHRTDPISAYGIHKLSIEKCFEYYGHTYDLNYLILRISNPYGPHQNPFGNQGIIPIFLAKALTGSTIEIWGDGSTIRDYIYVDDVIDACLSLMNYNGIYRIFNIGSGEGHSLKDVVEIIQKNVNNDLTIEYKPGRIQDVPINVLDNSLIQNEIDWCLKVRLEDGINKMIRLWNRDKGNFDKERG